MTDRRGGRRGTSGRKLTDAQKQARTLAGLRFKLWQAEKIGWPALAESFRRDLRALGVEP